MCEYRLLVWLVVSCGGNIELFNDVERDSNELYLLIEEYLQQTPNRTLPVQYEASDYESFNEEKIVADLIEKRPLIFRANRSTSKVIAITVGYRNGHAWVVDGVAVYEKNNSSTSSIAQNHKPIKRYHFHCNWGWGGRYNGYYETNLFKPGLEATNPNTETRGSNYNKNLQVCYGIKPRN
ncbi:MAG: C10 family peptidase [Bacteroidales bacterium]|nr:C10 family peptidase [Bacteroidales bacterium]